MKYIKPFNENNNEYDLKEFCEINLAYLLDNEDFQLNIDFFGDPEYQKQGQIRIENDNGFKWDDIKDYFIPFLIQLDKIIGHQIKIGLYRLVNEKLIFVHTYRGNWHKVKFDDLVNDSLVGSCELYLWDKIHIELEEDETY